MYQQCRDYQEEVINKFPEWMDSPSSQSCLSLATGMGKTKVAMEIGARHVKRGPLIWITHKLALLEQSSADNLLKPIYNNQQRSPSVATLRGGEQEKGHMADKDIVFVSASLLEENPHYLSQLTTLNPELVVIDEAHNQRAVYSKIRDNFKTLNLTATPFDPATLEPLDLGTNLGSIPYSKAVEMGVCMPVATANLDLQQLTLDTSKVWKEVQTNENLNLILDNIEPHIRNEPTLMCMKNLAQAKELQKLLQERGLKYGVISSNQKRDLELNSHLVEDPDNYRQELLQKLERKEIDGLLNFDVLVEGIDVPQLSRVVCFRPLDSATKYAQLIGRVARKAEGKKNALLIDVANTDMDRGKQIFLDVVKGRKIKHQAAVLHKGDPLSVDEEAIFEQSHYMIEDVKRFQETGQVPLPVKGCDIPETNSLRVGDKNVKFRELDFNKDDLIYLPNGLPLVGDVDALKQAQTSRLKPLEKMRTRASSLCKLELFRDLCTKNTKSKIDLVGFNGNTALRVKSISKKDEFLISFNKGVACLQKNKDPNLPTVTPNSQDTFLNKILELNSSVLGRLMEQPAAAILGSFIKSNYGKGFKKSCKGGIERSSLWDYYASYNNLYQNSRA